MLKLFRLLGVLMSLGVMNIAQGVVVPLLYTAEIFVNSQSSDERQAAFSQGLKTVLIKVSGNAQVTELPEINAAIQNPTNYVQTFSYVSIPPPSEGLKLVLKFNKQSIDHLLKRTDQPIWRQDRPLTLVWLMEKKNNEVEIPNLSHEADLNRVLTAQANFRGIAWLFPLLDMTDLQQINSNTLWNESIDKFKLISKRYAPDEILIIRLDNMQPSSPVASFTLIFPDKVLNWTESGNDRLSILQKGLDSTINHLASHFIEVRSQIDSNTLMLRIENLKNIEDYAALMRYLHSLTGVESVNVSNISFPVLEVQLGLNVSVDTLKRTIQLSPVLQPVDAFNQPLQTNQEFLTYQFHSI